MEQKHNNGIEAESTRFQQSSLSMNYKGRMRTNYKGNFHSCEDKHPATTLFIDNLPQSMSIEWLRQLFKYYGNMVDAYLPMKKRKTNGNPFGFVRYKKKQEAMRAIKELHGAKIRDCVIKVDIARYEKKTRSPLAKDKFLQRRTRSVSPVLNQRNGSSYAQVVTGNQEATDKMPTKETKIVQGEICKENFEWLKRSLIGEGLQSLSPQEIGNKLLARGFKIQKIIPIDGYKILLVFPSTEECDMALKQQQQELLSLLTEVRRWSEHETGHIRRAWIELKGLPLHGWSKENASRIADNWGDVKNCVVDCTDLRSAFVQIDTGIMMPINDVIQLNLGGFLYTIHASENRDLEEDSIKNRGANGETTINNGSLRSATLPIQTPLVSPPTHFGPPSRVRAHTPSCPTNFLQTNFTLPPHNIPINYLSNPTPPYPTGPIFNHPNYQNLNPANQAQPQPKPFNHANQSAIRPIYHHQPNPTQFFPQPITNTPLPKPQASPSHQSNSESQLLQELENRTFHPPPHSRDGAEDHQRIENCIPSNTQAEVSFVANTQDELYVDLAGETTVQEEATVHESPAFSHGLGRLGAAEAWKTGKELGLTTEEEARVLTTLVRGIPPLSETSTRKKRGRPRKTPIA